MQVYSNELYHYGVIGMKWGVRRYQNPDGSLTARGLSRYRKDSLKEAKKNYKNSDMSRAAYKTEKIKIEDSYRKAKEAEFKKRNPSYKGDSYYFHNGKRSYKDVGNSTRALRNFNDSGSYKQRGAKAAAQILAGSALYIGSALYGQKLAYEGKYGASIVVQMLGSGLGGLGIGSGTGAAINAISDYKESKRNSK